MNDLNIVSVFTILHILKQINIYIFIFSLVLQTTNSRILKQDAYFKNDSSAAKHLMFAYQDVQSIVFSLEINWRQLLVS